MKRKNSLHKNIYPNGHLRPMKLEEAKKDPDLAQEIYKQLNVALMVGKANTEYVASIKFRDCQYTISATQEEWKAFYNMI